jgi:hypothetical protein
MEVRIVPWKSGDAPGRGAIRQWETDERRREWERYVVFC